MKSSDRQFSRNTPIRAPHPGPSSPPPSGELPEQGTALPGLRGDGREDRHGRSKPAHPQLRAGACPSPSSIPIGPEGPPCIATDCFIKRRPLPVAPRRQSPDQPGPKGGGCHQTHIGAHLYTRCAFFVHTFARIYLFPDPSDSFLGDVKYPGMQDPLPEDDEYK